MAYAGESNMYYQDSGEDASQNPPYVMGTGDASNLYAPVGYAAGGDPLYRGPDGKLYHNSTQFGNNRYIEVDGGTHIYDTLEAAKAYAQGVGTYAPPTPFGGGGQGGGTFDGGGGGISGGAILGGGILAPFTGQFQAPPPGATPFPYQKPPAFDYPDFQEPTGEELLTDKGVQFRLKLGRQALSNDRAARGLYRTGATAKGLEEYTQNYASNEFGNLFNRKEQTYAMNRGNALDKYNTNYGTQYVDPYNFGVQGNNTAYQRARDEFLTNYGIFKDNQDRPYDKLLGVSQLGLNAAN